MNEDRIARLNSTSIIRCIDVETTGEDPAKDDAAVCELGWCDLVRDIQTSGTWAIRPPRSMLIDPKRPIPPQMSAIHHITNEMVQGEPTLAQALPILLKDAGSVVLCAHNARFEQKFITTPAPWICTYKVGVMLAPMAPAYKLQVLRYWLKLDVDPDLARDPHRAGCDAYIAAVLMKRMLAKMTIAEMVDLSARPIILPKLHFGKHEGEPVDQVPSHYWRWILDEEKHDPFDEDTVATARHYLKKSQKQGDLDV